MNGNREDNVVRPELTGDVHQTWPGKRWWQKPGPWCRFKARLGRRGAMMMLLGATYMIIGYGEATRPSAQIPGAFHLELDPYLRGLGWLATGAVAMIIALGRPHRLSALPVSWWQGDTPGWISLYLMPTIYITSFSRSWFLWLVADQAQIPPVGDPMAWYNAALRVPFVLIVLICSGWLENPRRSECA